MRKVILSLCCIALAASSATAASFASDEQTLRKLDREMAIATYMGDAEWFRLHLDDDYVGITIAGALQTKAELIAAIKKNDTQIEPYESSDVRIQAHGSTAIITGRVVQRYVEAGQRVTAELRYSNVWIKTEEGWFSASGQISPIAIKREPSRTAR